MGDGDPWFRPKTYGYGFVPANAKGLAATMVFVLIAIVTMSLLGDPANVRSPQSAILMMRLRADFGLSDLHLPWAARFAALGVELLVFFLFARSKSAPHDTSM